MRNTIARQVTVIPAEPGWALLEPYCDDDGTAVGFTAERILAWRIETDIVDQNNRDGHETLDEVTPVLLNPLSTARGLQVFRDPAGRMYAPCDQDFQSEAEVLAYCTKRLPEEQRRLEHNARLRRKGAA